MDKRTDCADKQRKPTDGTHELAYESGNLIHESAGGPDDPRDVVDLPDNPRLVCSGHLATSYPVGRKCLPLAYAVGVALSVTCRTGCRESAALDSGGHAESPCLACDRGPLGEAEHVGALGVRGTSAALIGRELAVWVDLALNRWRNFSRAARVRAVRSSGRLHEISAAIRLLMSLAAMGHHRPGCYAV